METNKTLYLVEAEYDVWEPWRSTVGITDDPAVAAAWVDSVTAEHRAFMQLPDRLKHLMIDDDGDVIGKVSKKDYMDYITWEIHPAKKFIKCHISEFELGKRATFGELLGIPDETV